MSPPSTPGQPSPARRVEAQEAAGQLKPSMHGFGALLITVSCLSPSVGVFVVGSETIKAAGTGVFACFCAAALLGLAMAAVYGELSAAFPETGGEYTIMGRALGPSWGVAALALNLVSFAVAESLSALGVATYLQPVFPGLPVVPAALGLVVLVTALAVLDIRINAWVTGLFLAVEIAALGALAVLGFSHAHRPLSAMLYPVTLTDAGRLAPLSLAAAGAATAGAIYAFDGYGSVVYLGEELHQASRRIARVVFLALGVAAASELAPLLAVLVGAPDLRALISADKPVPAVIAALGGAATARVMSLGVALAIFNTMAAMALMAGRQLYSTGRDRLWPSPLSRALARIHPRFGSPLNATLAMGFAALLGCLVDQKLLVLVLGNGNVALYAGMCAAALAGRRSGATRHAGWRMPLFPLAPLAALAALAAVAWYDLQDLSGALGLGINLATVAAAVAYQRQGRRGGEFAFRGPSARVEP